MTGNSAAGTEVDADRARALLERLDLTRLDSGDSPDRVALFCRRAATPFGDPAALCVLPEYVATAVGQLEEHGKRNSVRVATVANFPEGDQRVTAVARSIDAALEAGADEIDAVLPWKALVRGEIETVAELLETARRRCGRKVLKVILETGALEPDQITLAADMALDHGADFLKTSTGIGHPGASLEAASQLLDRIRARGADCGLKVSGGVRRAAMAETYLALAEIRMGDGWPSPDRFRIGASSLLDDLIGILESAQ